MSTAAERLVRACVRLPRTGAHFHKAGRCPVIITPAAAASHLRAERRHAPVSVLGEAKTLRGLCSAPKKGDGERSSLAERASQLSQTFHGTSHKINRCAKHRQQRGHVHIIA